jgi:S1-C subfamily serine protease
VVQDCVELRAILHDGRELPAVVVAADARCDLAVLRVPQQGLTPARFCDWSGVARGQWTLALGNPYGLAADGQASVAVGVVANLGRQIPGLGAEDDRFYYDMLQTTASIHPGHSGGPLFNLSGELVGVITAMHTHAPADEGAAFAIPLTPGRRRVIETLCAGQTPRYGYLGLSVRSLEADERGGGVRGVIVQQVEPGGPADAAGVQIGDRVVSADGQALGAPGQMAQLVGQAPVGSRVELALVRDGRALVLSVETALREAGRAAWLRDRSVTWRGLRAADLPAETAQPTRGVRVLEVADGSPAQRAGVRPGDIIVGVGAEDAADTATFLLRAYATRGRAMLRLADGRALEIES